MWSENESPNNHPKGPIDHLLAPGKGVCPLCHVAEEEVCRWEGVNEDCQHPGHELEGRQLGGKISIDTESMSIFWKLFFKRA